MQLKGIIGKSTLCNIVQQYLRREFSDIPLCNIVEDVEKNIELFTKYLSNQRQHGLEFQKWIIQDKLQQYTDALIQYEHSQLIVVMDRSLLADRHVFCRNLVEKSLMSDMDQLEYAKTFEELSKKYPSNLFHPNMHVILEASMEVIMQRINKRNRVGESSVYNRTYLEMIDKFHTDMYNNLESNVDHVVYRFDNNLHHNITSVDDMYIHKHDIENL